MLLTGLLYTIAYILSNIGLFCLGEASPKVHGIRINLNHTVKMNSLSYPRLELNRRLIVWLYPFGFWLESLTESTPLRLTELRSLIGMSLPVQPGLTNEYLVLFAFC